MTCSVALARKRADAAQDHARARQAGRDDSYVRWPLVTVNELAANLRSGDELEVGELWKNNSYWDGRPASSPTAGFLKDRRLPSNVKQFAQLTWRDLAAALQRINYPLSLTLLSWKIAPPKTYWIQDARCCLGHLSVNGVLFEARSGKDHAPDLFVHDSAADFRVVLAKLRDVAQGRSPAQMQNMTRELRKKCKKGTYRGEFFPSPPIVNGD